MRYKPTHLCMNGTMRGEIKQSKQAQWDGGLLRVYFEFLDAHSLAQCEAVNRQWRAEAGLPAVWETLYCLSWRFGRRLPASLELDKLTLQDWKRICLHHNSVSLEVSTRCSHYITRRQTIAAFAPCTLSVRTKHNLQALAISRRTSTNTNRQHSRVCYFEARFKGSGSMGITSPCYLDKKYDYGGLTSKHVGWIPVSYGYHSNDGRVHWTERHVRHTEEYGPQWGVRAGAKLDTIGCGFDSHTGQLFFTKNGIFLGYTAVRVLKSREYAGAVVLTNRLDVVDINVGRKPFVFDIEAFVASGATPSP